LLYWAREAFRHAGWGDIELEQVNQRRFNQSLAVINTILRFYGIDELSEIDLAALRSRYEKELKSLKSQNAKIREQNEMNKDNPGM